MAMAMDMADLMGLEKQPTRKTIMMQRMRKNLKKKREALADQFDFRMYIMFHFKDEKKKAAIFEMDEVQSVMTNNFTIQLLQGVRSEAFSDASSKELQNKDVVQCHSLSWRPLRKDVAGCKTPVDFFLWPRNDIESISCHMFSKWKEDEGPFRLINASFTMHSKEYEPYLSHILKTREKDKHVAANEPETFFLFVDVVKLKMAKNRKTVFKMRNACAFIPQDQLMNWTNDTVEDVLALYK